MCFSRANLCVVFACVCVTEGERARDIYEEGVGVCIMDNETVED